MQKLIFICLMTLTFSVFSFGQVPLSGRVVNANGNGVNGVTVHAIGGNCQNDTWATSAITSPFGYYSMSVYADQCDVMAVIATHHAYTVFEPDAYFWTFGKENPASEAGYKDINFVAIE